ncbi:uncharacterized protein [Panulirus ornatus]|uniref:uncharacterized protein isoform X2 n=1 Tax=Panulirus ornatus TaxID=150431 RepID=UPI003A8C4F34
MPLTGRVIFRISYRRLFHQDGGSLTERPRNPRIQMTLYDVLGVSQDASETEIRRQYQELARQYHPDKSAIEGAKEKFLQVTEAWHILGDTQKRREYDDQLKREKLYQEFPVGEEKQMDLYVAFMDLEKAYDRVDRDAQWKALRLYGVGIGEKEYFPCIPHVL